MTELIEFSASQTNTWNAGPQAQHKESRTTDRHFITSSPVIQCEMEAKIASFNVSNALHRQHLRCAEVDSVSFKPLSKNVSISKSSDPPNERSSHLAPGTIMNTNSSV